MLFMASTMAALAPLASIQPAHAFFFWDGTCTVTAKLTFGSPIGATPINTTYNLGADSTGCTSYPVPTIMAIADEVGFVDVSCDAIQSTGPGSGDFLFSAAPSDTTGFDLVSGPTNAQSWTFLDINTDRFAARASMAWADTGQITQCHTLGISTLTLVGVVTYEDPTLTR